MSTFLFGPHSVEDALRAKRKVEVVYISENRRRREVSNILDLAKELKVKVQFVPPLFFNKFKSDSKIPHQGIVAKTEEIKVIDFKEWISKVNKPSNPVVLLIDHIEDPHNFGAIIRSAAAFGIDGVIFPKNRNATFGPAAERSAAGGQNFVFLIMVSNIAETISRLKEEGFWVIGADSHGEGILHKDQLKQPVAIVVGAEHQGLHRLVKDRCDQLVKIPISEKMDSLNVSVATGIFLWEFSRYKK